MIVRLRLAWMLNHTEHTTAKMTNLKEFGMRTLEDFW
jgi:hypothetical protein